MNRTELEEKIALTIDNNTNVDPNKDWFDTDKLVKELSDLFIELSNESKLTFEEIKDQEAKKSHYRDWNEAIIFLTDAEQLMEINRCVKIFTAQFSLH